MVILEAKNIVKSSSIKGQNPPILKNIDIQVYEGEFLIITGPSGSGKSTLINILSGIDIPSSGSVLYKGKDIANLGKLQNLSYRQNVVGIAYQKFNLISSVSAKTNIKLPRIFSHKNLSSVQFDVDTLLKDLQIKGKENLHATGLSMGEQQRVAIARALINNPEIIFADEPTGSLDTQNADQVMGILQKINKEQHKTILFVTHNTRFLPYADRIITLKDGNIESINIKNEAFYQTDTQLKESGDIMKPGSTTTLTMLSLAIMSLLGMKQKFFITFANIFFLCLSILLLIALENTPLPYIAQLRDTNTLGKIILDTVIIMQIINIVLSIMHIIIATMYQKPKELAITIIIGGRFIDLQKYYFFIASTFILLAIFVSLIFIPVFNHELYPGIRLSISPPMSFIAILGAIFIALIAIIYPAFILLPRLQTMDELRRE